MASGRELVNIRGRHRLRHPKKLQNCSPLKGDLSVRRASSARISSASGADHQYSSRQIPAS
jgi:hypothetical protein